MPNDLRALLTPAIAQNRQGPISVANTSGVRVVNGAWRVAQGTTNYATWPRDGWEHHNDASATFDAAAPVDDPIFPSTRIQTAGFVAGEGANLWSYRWDWTVPANMSVTGSVWINDGGNVLWLVLQEWHAGWSIATNAIINTPGDGVWRRYSVVLPVQAGWVVNGMNLSVGADVSWTGTVPSVTFWVSHPQIEDGAYATPFVDHNMFVADPMRPDPHIEIAASQLGMDPDRGSAVVRLRKHDENGEGNQWLWTLGDWMSGQQFIGALYLPLADSAQVVTYNGTTENVTEVPMPVGSWVNMYVAWTATTVAIRVGDGALTTVARATPAGTLGGYLFLGHYYGAQYSNVDVAAWAGFGDTLTEAEVDRIFALETWDATTLQGGYTPVPDVAVVASTNPIVMYPRIWRSDLYRNFLEELEPVIPYRGTVSYNEDRQFRRELSVEVINPSALVPLGDFLAPELVQERADGSQRVIPLGHYIVLPPQTSLDAKMMTGQVRGWDITYLLSRSLVDEEYVVVAGTDTGAAARQVFAEFGIPPHRLDIPDSGVLLAEEQRWAPGTNRLHLGNDLLDSGGMYVVWTDSTGVLMSRHYQDLDQVAPTLVYGTHEGLRIISDVRERPNWDRVKNQVTVRKVTPDQPTIWYTATVTNESSPVHPQRLAERMGSSVPIIMGESVDDHTVETTEAARLKAEGLLSMGASYHTVIEFEHLICGNQEAHQIVDVRIGGPDGEVYSGNWWRRTWTIQMEGVVAKMTSEFNRTVGVR